jgi:fructokinase
MGERNHILGGIEAGGTKIVCAVAKGPRDPLVRARFSTGEPGTTLAEVGRFFRDAREEFEGLDALGIGSFGPVGVVPGAANF